MTREDYFFQRILAGSFVTHLLFFGILALLPTGEPGTDITVYTVQLLEVPARPEALDLEEQESDAPRMSLMPPSLNPEANGAADLEAPELPPAADEATVAPPTAEQPPPAAPEKPADATPPRLEVPGLKLPEAPRETPQPPAALENLPGLPDAPQAPESFSGKESLSPPPAPGQEQQAPQSASEHQSGGLTPPTLGEGETQPDTMQRIRKRVEDINLRVESLPPRQTGIPSAQKEEQSLLALRIFSNRVREAVKENYTFPGGFPPELRTRVRVVLNRDGTVKEAKVIQPSGNPRFDQLVCLASIHKARFPHVPAEVDGEEIPFNITCAP